MKNFRFLILSILSLGLIFSSCSSDEKGVGGDDVVGGKTTYAGINIILPESATSTRAEDASAGIAGEKDIKNIGVYIIDINSGHFDFKVIENNSANFEESTNSEGRKVYKAKVAIKTVTGIKNLFVVANPTAKLQSTLEAKTGSSMNPAAFGLPSTDFLSANGETLESMVMSGAYVLTEGKYDMTEVKSESQAMDSPAQITVQRNLAKVVLQKATDYKVVDGSTTTLTWDVINRAKDAYLLKQENTLYHSVPSSAIDDENDLYWSNFLGMTGSDYISVLEYGAGDKKDAAYADSKYVFENLPEKFYTGNTTAARIKGVYKPAKIFGSIVDGIPQDVANNFQAGTDFYRSKIEGTYWTLDGRDAAIDKKYNGHATTADFTYYKDAVGYYTIWVNNGSDKGVNRNNYYLLQIREVRGPGSPDENEQPETPVAEDTHLGVEVTVLNWDFNKAVEDIQ